MKKSYLTLSGAIAIALLSTSSFAEGKTEVYGELRLSVDSTSFSGSGLTASQAAGTAFVGRNSGTTVRSNATRLGVKGFQDTKLTDTQMIYQAEMEYSGSGESKASGSTDATVIDNTIFVREAFAGLKSNTWGQIRIGRLTTGYKKSYVGIDPWTDHVLQARQGGVQGVSSLNSNYFNNAVEYESPSFNGFSFNAFASSMTDNSSEQLQNAGVLARYKGGSATGVGVKYAIGNLNLTADVLTLNADEAKSKATTATFGANGQVKNGTSSQFTAKYKFGNGFGLGGIYEDATGINQGVNNFAIATQDIGKDFMVSASYGLNRGDNSNVYGKKDGTTMNLAGLYKLTDKSILFAGYSVHNRDTDAALKREAGTFTVGIDAKF
jgi:predicted porin